MNIGTNIYTLRKEKGITQAQLAEKLGVSDQAVSKWETEQCAPDVSLFPLMAEYFGVSIDRLFGYHKRSYSEDIETIMKAADDSFNSYKEIEILRDGLKRYPNSPELKIYLAFSLSEVYRMSENESERQESVASAIRLCNEVTDTCGDLRQVDFALNMLCRIYCETGEFQKALDAVEKISVNGYLQRIVGKAKILQYRKEYGEHARFTEENMLDCFIIMDRLFELKRKSLVELRDYKTLLSWCRAHEKLLAVFDEGCEDFYVSHKVHVHETMAMAYRNLGDQESCLQELERLSSLLRFVKNNAKGEDYQFAVRNPLFFSSLTDPGSQEEFMTTFPLQAVFAKYDRYLEGNEQYILLKNSLHI